MKIRSKRLRGEQRSEEEINRELLDHHFPDIEFELPDDFADTVPAQPGFDFGEQPYDYMIVDDIDVNGLDQRKPV